MLLAVGVVDDVFLLIPYVVVVAVVSAAAVIGIVDGMLFVLLTVPS